MTMSKLILLFVSLILASLSQCANLFQDDTENYTAHNISNPKLVCYFACWSVYRPNDGKYNVDNIDPFLCSHIIYAFAILGDDHKIKSHDPYNDLTDNYGKGSYSKFNALKVRKSGLKTMIAIGGWEEGSVKYSEMVAKQTSRKVFVDSVVEFLGKYGFDGLDFDWEYPANRGGKPQDKYNLVHLFRELKVAFAPRGYLLTSAVSAGKEIIDNGYDIPDFINVMCYDYHGGWDKATRLNSPLYDRPSITNDKYFNAGAPKHKIVMGMAAYGRSFTLANPIINGLSAPAPEMGQPGPYTRAPGMLGYNEICRMKASTGWTEVRDPYHLTPYVYRDREWIGFDDTQRIQLKAQFIKSMGLAGGMVWSLDTDDFHGKCGPKYPLLNAISLVFGEEGQDEFMPVDTIDGDCEISYEPIEQGQNLNATTDISPLNSTTDKSPFSCPGVGYFKNPHNCQKCYQCAPTTILNSYQAYEKDCRNGTAFNSFIQVCDWPANVPGCKV